MNSVVLGLLSIKAKTAKPSLNHIMMSLALYKTMHNGLYHIQHTPNECFNRFSFCILNCMYQTLEFLIISENKIETCGEIRIKWGDAVLF